MCFCYFWKDKSSLIWNLFFNLFFTYFKLYIWISGPNSSMEGYEGGIFSKAPGWKPLFLLRIKLKENAGFPNKEYNAIFKHIHQNIRAYLRCKEKSALVNNWEKILFYTIKNPCKVTRCRTSSFVPDKVWRSGRAAQPKKKNYRHLSLETVFPALTLTQNCYINTNISFSWKFAIWSCIGFPFLPPTDCRHLVSERLSSQFPSY